MTTTPTDWRRPPRIGSPVWRWLLIGGGALYLLVACESLDIDFARLARGGERAMRIFGGFLRPDFVKHREEIAEGLIESLAMTALATVLGVILAIPLGIGAARTLAPRPIYWMSRLLLALSRSLHEVIVAIVLVVAVGFGPLAGVITLIVASVGFLGKLLAEAIEGVDVAPLEAIRATGAAEPAVLIFAVLPQVMARFWGLALYRLDINFRESAILGVVGAGGIGATLNTAFDRYDYPTGAAVVLLIVLLVWMAELAAGMIRSRWLR